MLCEAPAFFCHSLSLRPKDRGKDRQYGNRTGSLSCYRCCHVHLTRKKSWRRLIKLAARSPGIFHTTRSARFLRAVAIITIDFLADLLSESRTIANRPGSSKLCRAAALNTMNIRRRLGHWESPRNKPLHPLHRHHQLPSSAPKIQQLPCPPTYNDNESKKRRSGGLKASMSFVRIHTFHPSSAQFALPAQSLHISPESLSGRRQSELSLPASLGLSRLRLGRGMDGTGRV